ncbi:MAG: aromatic ring-hydroxylating dioxygenase subunit alpha [Cyanobacteria bacterium J06641_5]
MDIRQADINPNCWYVVAPSAELKGDRPLGVTLWQQDIVLYRHTDGTVSALEDRCPHRQVKLSQGKVLGDRLECAYHGWQFEASGRCARVPYLQARQKLPACKLQPYPVREQDGFIWLFPGDAALADRLPLLGLPEWDDLNFIASVATIECQAHFSFLIENLMDMYHGHLHQDWQAWAEASLEEIRETDARVDADYSAQSYYRIDKIWSVLQLFVPALRRLHPEPLRVSYVYPHWYSTLGQDFRIYCLFCPVGPRQTRAYLIHFTSLQSFWRLHKLPVWFRRGLKNALFGSAKGLLAGLVRQDVVAIEQEQQAYLENPSRRNYELNQTAASVQRAIRFQALAAHRAPDDLPTVTNDILALDPEGCARDAIATYSSDRANSRSK